MTEAPVRTPAGSAKSLQLTPIWEEVVKNQRVPPDIAVIEILREIRGRLRAGEWEVRQHALRVLTDVLSVAGEPAEGAELQAALVSNLGSPAPGVRRAAREALSQLLQKIPNPESNLLELLGGCNDENITLGIIIALPDLLRSFLFPANGGYVLSAHCLTAIVVYLVNKVSVPIYRDASVDTLMKIKDMCGDAMFQSCLEHISPDPKTLQLLTLNLDDSGVDFKLPLRDHNWKESTATGLKTSPSWSDNSESEEIHNSVTTYHNYDLVKRDSQPSSEDGFSDGTDDTYTKETSDSAKVVLETEIQFSEQRAITMRIMEEDSVENEHGVMLDERFVSADGSLVMSVVPPSDEDGLRRTPRRVRFGGEVIKLCTPDSDATDVRIEIQDGVEHSVDRLVIDRLPKTSQIPLPISPATSKPQALSHSPRLQKSLSEETFKSSSFSSFSEDTEITSLSSSNPATEPSISSSALPVIEVSFDSSESFGTSMDSATPIVADETIASSKSSSDSSTEVREPNVSVITNNNDVKNGTAEYSTDLWSWEILGLLDEYNLDILKAKDDSKRELSALEQLRRNLQANDAQLRFQDSDVSTIRSLLRYLLEHARPHTAETALYAVGIVVQLLPINKAAECLEDLVAGVCRYVGGSNSMNVKLASVDNLHLLFSRFAPAQVLDVLLGNRCLHSPSSKMRENSLLVLLYTLMTYPSTIFSTQRLLEESCRSVADPRRRVRHAALETLAVLGQFIPSSQILDHASKMGNSQLVAAISTRLARRSLPSVSSDGLVLYALQIPSARRLGHTGPPQGSDVDWILAGTGSLSTGSARSRGQLKAAQGPRWGSENNIVHRSSKPENPWTAQKHRMQEDSLAWALVPVSNLDDGIYGQGTEQNYIGGSRPFLVKLANADESLRSQRYAVHRVADAPHNGSQIRVLTPSVLRRKPDTKTSPWTESRERGTEVSLRDQRRTVRDNSAVDYNILDSSRKVIDTPARTILVASTPISEVSTPPAAVFLPSIHGNDKPRIPDKPIRPRETLPPRFIDAPHQRSNLITTPPSLSQSLPIVYRTSETTSSSRAPPLEVEQVVTISPINSQESQDKLFERLRRDPRESARVSMTSAPAAIPACDREISSSMSDQASAVLEPSGDSLSTSQRGLTDHYNQKVIAKRKGLTSKITPTQQNFPDSLKPFERAKEGLETCFNQLEASQWEVTMLGLTSLVRLIRHHPAIVVSNIHALISALSRHNGNLRSQVARAACNVSEEVFTTLKKTVEPELEEITGSLFNRTADTNKFIRADSNKALDAMVDTMAPPKVVTVILVKGVAHPNATVRTTAARLLLRLTERIGPEKALGLQREIRDKMLKAGAALLTEGRLETREFAKQLFRSWSSRPEFGNIITEVIPQNTMRSISKTLSSLRS